MMAEHKAMQLKIFRYRDYKDIAKFEEAVNKFLYELQVMQIPNQMTTLQDIIYILHEQTSYDGGGIQ